MLAGAETPSGAPCSASQAFASSALSVSKRTFAALRPGRATAGWSLRISSFVVTSTRMRSPWPISPSATFRKRDRPWPMIAFASGWSSSPVSSSTSRRQLFFASRPSCSSLSAESTSSA